MLVGGRSAGSSAPSHLRAEQVSAFSVKLAWHPSSSNFKHLVLLNGRMFLTCPPAQYKCLLTGLEPDTLYHVVVRALSGEGLSSPAHTLLPADSLVEALSRRLSQSTDAKERSQLEFELQSVLGRVQASLDVRTLPSLGVGIHSQMAGADPLQQLQLPLAYACAPSPPAPPRLHAQPDGSGNLLLSWISVFELAPFVAGYRVFLEGTLFKEVHDPCAEQTILEASALASFVSIQAAGPRQLFSITIRSFSVDQRESVDSNPVFVPSPLWASPLLNNLNSQQQPLSSYNTIFTASRGFNYLNREMPYDGRFSNYAANPTLNPSAAAYSADPRWSRSGGAAIAPYYTEPLYAAIDVPPRDVPLSNAGAWTASVDAPPPMTHQYSPHPQHPNSKQTAAYNQQYSDSGQSGSLYSSPTPNQQWSNEGPGPMLVYPGAAPRRDGWQQQQQPQRSRISNEYEPPVYEHTFGPDALVAASPQSARRGRSSGSDVERSSKRGVARRPAPQSLLYAAGESRRPDVGVSPTEWLDDDRERYSDASGHYSSRGAHGQRRYDSADVNPRRSRSSPRPTHPRRFIALYDYNPQVMSPNPNSTEELEFKQGQVIWVYGEMDEDGFYRGECNSQNGLVPSNMVKELAGGKSDRKQRNGLEKRSHSNEPGPGGRSTLSGSDEERSYFGVSATAVAARSDRPRSAVPTKHSSGYDSPAAGSHRSGGGDSQRQRARRMVVTRDFRLGRGGNKGAKTREGGSEGPSSERSETSAWLRAGDVVRVFGDPVDEGYIFAELNSGSKRFIPFEILRDAEPILMRDMPPEEATASSTPRTRPRHSNEFNPRDELHPPRESKSAAASNRPSRTSSIKQTNTVTPVGDSPVASFKQTNLQPDKTSSGRFRDGEDHGASSSDQSIGAAGRSHRQRDAPVNRATATSVSAHGSQSLSDENTPPETRSNSQSGALSPLTQSAPSGSGGAMGGAIGGGGRSGPAGPHFKAGPVKSIIKEESGEIESSESLHSIATRSVTAGDRPASQRTKRTSGGSSAQTPTSPDFSQHEAGIKSDGVGPSRNRRAVEPNGRQPYPNK